MTNLTYKFWDKVSPLRNGIGNWQTADELLDGFFSSEHTIVIGVDDDGTMYTMDRMDILRANYNIHPDLSDAEALKEYCKITNHKTNTNKLTELTKFLIENAGYTVANQGDYTLDDLLAAITNE